MPRPAPVQRLRDNSLILTKGFSAKEPFLSEVSCSLDFLVSAFSLIKGVKNIYSGAEKMTFSKSGVDEGRTTRFFPSLAFQHWRYNTLFNSSNAGYGNGALLHLPISIMNVALLGKKIGMTQVFDDNNRLVPVTVIEAGPCPVTQIKSSETDGYNAVQIGFRPQKEHRL